MLSRQFTLCEADKIPAEVKLTPNIDIIIPEVSIISPIYQTGVKDYVISPKGNGYQSLHTVFRARNSSFVEIQVRTEQMHLNAEYHSADHVLYKVDKYGERLHSKIDFSKINMPGFRYMDNGLIYDDIGLQTSQYMHQTSGEPLHHIDRRQNPAPCKHGTAYPVHPHNRRYRRPAPPNNLPPVRLGKYPSATAE